MGEGMSDLPWVMIIPAVGCAVNVGMRNYGHAVMFAAIFVMVALGVWPQTCVG
jgi:uncharacterized membrane protein YccC